MEAENIRERADELENEIHEAIESFKLSTECHNLDITINKKTFSIIGKEDTFIYEIYVNVII